MVKFDAIKQIRNCELRIIGALGVPFTCISSPRTMLVSKQRSLSDVR